MSAPIPPLDGVRPMQHRDCDRVAMLHAADMGQSLWAELGQAFLVEIYRALIDSPHFLGFVWEGPPEAAVEAGGDLSRVQGFIAGTTNGTRMMREIRERRWMVLGMAALPGVLRKPRLLGPLRQTDAYFEVSQSGQPDTAVPGESLFCTVAEPFRRQGIGDRLNTALFEELLARHHPQVRITTEAANLNAQAHLQGWGFRSVHRFVFYGKDMVVWVLDLPGHPRIAPQSRHPAV